jgi:hypothetical protein
MRAGGLTMLLLASGWTGTAMADPPTSPDLLAARRELASYDLHGGTLEVIRSLGEAMRTHEGANQREARFLRAVATTDLLLVARGHHEPERFAEIAAAFGVEESALYAELDRELARLEMVVYAEVARDCRWALRVIRSEHVAPEVLRDGEGERRDVLYVNAVVDALGEPDEIERLARLGTDPCGGYPNCPLAAFADEGRRAANALREANTALTRLETIADAGEPLTRALAAVVAADGALLRTTQITPTPRLPDDVAIAMIGEHGSPAQLDAIVVVTPSAIRIGYVPTVRVQGDSFVVTSQHEPALPQFEDVRYSDDGRAAIAPFDSLAPRFAALHERGVRVGLAASGEVPALTVTRMLITMMRANMSVPELVGRGAHGEVRTVPVANLVMGEEVTPPLALFVRMGGYTLNRGQSSIDIPRVRGANGLRFDVASLEQRARAAGRVPASLRYMSAVDWGTVVDAAFHLRSEPGPLSLVLY